MKFFCPAPGTVNLLRTLDEGREESGGWKKAAAWLPAADWARHPPPPGEGVRLKKSPDWQPISEKADIVKMEGPKIMNPSWGKKRLLARGGMSVNAIICKRIIG